MRGSESSYSVETRLNEWGYRLPPAPTPLAAYRPVVQHGALLFTSGQLPFDEHGELVAKGLVGESSRSEKNHDAGQAQVTTENAQEAAKYCLFNALAAIKEFTGTLDRVERVIKMTGFVASATNFFDQPTVIDGASQLLVTLWGSQGQHARSAVGVAALPRNAAVELELVVALKAPAAPGH